MVRIELENLYRVYKQSQKKNALISEDDLKHKLLKLLRLKEGLTKIY